jgi:hypothetical protein
VAQHDQPATAVPRHVGPGRTGGRLQVMRPGSNRYG